MELAFERVDMPIRWQGLKGMTEVGVLAQGPNAGRVLVTICADFFRPVEVRPLLCCCSMQAGSHAITLCCAVVLGAGRVLIAIRATLFRPIEARLLG